MHTVPAEPGLITRCQQKAAVEGPAHGQQRWTETRMDHVSRVCESVGMHACENGKVCQRKAATSHLLYLTFDERTIAIPAGNWVLFVQEYQIRTRHKEQLPPEVIQTTPWRE